MNRTICRTVIITLCLLASFSSCRNQKQIQQGTEGKKVSNAKEVLSQIEAHSFSYDALEVKRISCKVGNGDKTLSFKASLSSMNNEFIDLSVTKFLPIAKAHIDQQEVAVISYLEGGYYQGEYSLLADKFGVELDYSNVQSMLTGSFYRTKSSSLAMSQNDDYYILSSIIGGKSKDALSLKQVAYVNKTSFKIEKLLITDAEGRTATVEYSNFVVVDSQTIASQVDITFNNITSVLKANLTLSKISLSKQIESTFEISDKYKKLN